MVNVILTWIRLNHFESFESLRIIWILVGTLFGTIYTWGIILSDGLKVDSTKNFNQVETDRERNLGHFILESNYVIWVKILVA